MERSMAKDGKEGAVSGELRLLRRRGVAMLAEALCCGDLTDVVFELDDGSRPVGGHRAVLSCGSREFERMFKSGMRERREGVVRMRGVGASAVKGLLEWVYLGEWRDVCEDGMGVCSCV